MFREKTLVLCVILLFMWKHIEAGKLPRAKSNKRHDEALQTFIYESNDDDMQANATTIYPPLIEEPSNPVSIKAIRIVCETQTKDIHRMNLIISGRR